MLAGQNQNHCNQKIENNLGVRKLLGVSTKQDGNVGVNN